jgi:hypothetical protein
MIKVRAIAMLVGGAGPDRARTVDAVRTQPCLSLHGKRILRRGLSQKIGGEEDRASNAWCPRLQETGGDCFVESKGATLKGIPFSGVEDGFVQRGYYSAKIWETGLEKCNRAIVYDLFSDAVRSKVPKEKIPARSVREDLPLWPPRGGCCAVCERDSSECRHRF